MNTRRLYVWWCLGAALVLGMICGMAWASATTPAPAVVMAPPDDGLTPAERALMPPPGPSASVDRDVIIVHRSLPIVYFGMYRASMMTEPGWDLYSRAVNWANDGREPADTRVWLATYNGSLDPNISAERDGIAVLNYLVNTMGFLRNNITVGHQSTIETQNFDGYDLVLYAWVYPRDASNVLRQGKPFVTTSSGETDELGIGDGQEVMHEFRDNAFILNNAHPITDGYARGQFTLQAGMWMDASTAAGEGLVLIAADDRQSVCTGEETLKAKCKRGGKLIATIKKGQPDVDLTVDLDTGESQVVHVNNRGKAKVKFTDVASGERTVRIVECGVQKNTVCPD